MKTLDVLQLLEVCRDADIAETQDIIAQLLQSLDALGSLVADHLGVDFYGIEQSTHGVEAGFVPRRPGDGCPPVLAEYDDEGAWPMSRQRTVLVCDDDPAQTSLARHAVTGPEVQVIETHSGEEAWLVYQTTPVDMVVTDIRLSDFDGFELLRRIATHQSNRGGRRRKVPVITISDAEWVDGQHRNIDQAGGVVHLTKPVNWTRLGLFISELCQLS